LLIYHHEPVTLKEFIDKIGNKSITFTGDSLHHQFWELLCGLAKQDNIVYEVKRNFIHLKSDNMKEVEFTNINDPNITTWFYTLKFNSGLRINYIRYYSSNSTKFTLKYPYITFALSVSDFLIMSIGPHYRNDIHIKSELQKILPLLKNSTANIIFREVLPVHFKTPDGTFESFNSTIKNCASGNLLSQREKLKLIREFVTTHGFGYIYAFHLYEESWDLHLEKYYNKHQNDCVHYLMSPIVWGPLVQSLFNIILCYQAQPMYVLV